MRIKLSALLFGSNFWVLQRVQSAINLRRVQKKWPQTSSFQEEFAMQKRSLALRIAECCVLLQQQQ